MPLILHLFVECGIELWSLVRCAVRFGSPPALLDVIRRPAMLSRLREELEGVAPPSAIPAFGTIRVSARAISRREELRAARIFPIGGGRRRCLGVAFASFEMPIILATVLHRFAFRLAPQSNCAPRYGGDHRAGRWSSRHRGGGSRVSAALPRGGDAHPIS